MLPDKIWITYKCRMLAEQRYRHYNPLSHLLTCYYSLLLIILSIFSGQIVSNPQIVQGVGITFSVVVFALSLVLYGFHFGETADKHRECYLRLQSLYNSNPDAVNLAVKYDEIISVYPNHSPRDYRDLIVETVLNGHNPITSPGKGPSLSPNWLQYLEYVLRKAMFVIFGYLIHIIWPVWAAFLLFVH